MTEAWEALCQYAACTARWQHTAGLLQWDQETGMPKKAAPSRALQQAELAQFLHQRLHDGRWDELLQNALNQQQALLPKQQKALAHWLWEQDKSRKIPESHVVQLSLLQAKSFEAWGEARQSGQAKPYLNCLETLVELKRQECNLLGFAAHPYEALLDNYDPKLKVSFLDEIFSTLEKNLTPRLLSIEAHMPTADFPIAMNATAQLAFGEELLQWLGFDLTRGRLDKAPHPFCLPMSPNDVRLTYQLDETQPGVFIWALLHEAGHGLYEQGLPQEPPGTPLTSSVSLTIHESQSRFWENHVGRSLAFWQFVAEGKGWGHHIPEAIWLHANQVKRSQVRIYADEISYHLHVLLRYRLEKSLLENSLDVKDLESAWNEMAHAFFGQTPKNPKEGFAQDIHWAHGSMGYFPTYTLGSLLASQFANTLNPDSGLNVSKLHHFLNYFAEHVFEPGALLRSEELTGGKAQPLVECFLNYIDKKYAAYL